MREAHNFKQIHLALAIHISVLILPFRIIIIIRVFCPRAGPSLQGQEPRLQFRPKQAFYRKLRDQECSFTRD